MSRDILKAVGNIYLVVVFAVWSASCYFITHWFSLVEIGLFYFKVAPLIVSLVHFVFSGAMVVQLALAFIQKVNKHTSIQVRLVLWQLTGFCALFISMMLSGFVLFSVFYLASAKVIEITQFFEHPWEQIGTEAVGLILVACGAWSCMSSSWDHLSSFMDKLSKW